VVHHHVVAVHARCDLVRDAHSERHWTLGQQGLIEIAVGNPDHLAARVVERCQDLRDVNGLAALVDQNAFQDLSSKHVFVDALIFTEITGSALAGTSSARASMRTLFTWLKRRPGKSMR